MHSSPTDVKQALQGADYPASADELIDLARENDAPEEVVEELQEGLDGQDYDSPAEVMAELGE